MIHSLEYLQLSATFPPALRSAREAREFVRSGLREAGADAPVLAERVILATSELVTNAVVHARTEIEVRLVVKGADIWLEVLDEAPARPSHADPSLTETNGRGLVLVDALVDEWGVAEISGGRGKAVWIRISQN